MFLFITAGVPSSVVVVYFSSILAKCGPKRKSDVCFIKHATIYGSVRYVGFGSTSPF